MFNNLPQGLKNFIKNAMAYLALIIVFLLGFQSGTINERSAYSNLTNRTILEKDQAIAFYKDDLGKRLDKLTSRLEDITAKNQQTAKIVESSSKVLGEVSKETQSTVNQKIEKANK